MIGEWWHRRVLGHTLDVRRVSAPMWDAWATGRLTRCSCGRTWAR